MSSLSIIGGRPEVGSVLRSVPLSLAGCAGGVEFRQPKKVLMQEWLTVQKLERVERWAQNAPMFFVCHLDNVILKSR